MDNTWVAQFYEETDPVKRMEMLEAHGEDAAGEEASEEASEEAKRNACRKELWVVRYGKRRPRKDEFVGGFVELNLLRKVNNYFYLFYFLSQNIFAYHK